GDGLDQPGTVVSDQGEHERRHATSLEVAAPARYGAGAGSVGRVLRGLACRRTGHARRLPRDAVDAMLIHGCGAERAPRVGGRHVRGLVRVAELCRPLDLEDQAIPGGPEAPLPVPWRRMPQSSLSSAHDTIPSETVPRKVLLKSAPGLCARYWDRTSDLFRVREARYRCANRACEGC